MMTDLHDALSVGVFMFTKRVCWEHDTRDVKCAVLQGDMFMTFNVMFPTLGKRLLNDGIGGATTCNHKKSDLIRVTTGTVSVKNGEYYDTVRDFWVCMKCFTIYSEDEYKELPDDSTD